MGGEAVVVLGEDNLKTVVRFVVAADLEGSLAQNEDHVTIIEPLLQDHI